MALVKKTSYLGPEKQIMVADELTFSLGAIIGNTGVDADENGRKIIKAGTPLTGDYTARTTPFVLATDSSVKGVFTLQITSAFDEDETLTIAGVTYTRAAIEDIAAKKFAGSTAAKQVESLLKMVTTEKYDVAAVSGATDKIGFTQKVVDATDTTGPVVSATSTTGAIGSVTKVTDPVAGSSNANCISLHDIDVTSGNTNGTIVVRGFVDLDKLDEDVVALVNSAKTALDKRIIFIK